MFLIFRMFNDSQQRGLSREAILFESLFINVRHLGFFLTVLPQFLVVTHRPHACPTFEQARAVILAYCK
jgi:hypothetical protein